MAGVAPHPSREIYLELAKRIQIDGGKVMTQRHDPQRLEYASSINPVARRQAEDGAETCGCGDTRMVTIPYMREVEREDGTTIEVEKRYVACVNCDAVALQPRWVQGRFAGGA